MKVNYNQTNWSDKTEVFDLCKRINNSGLFHVVVHRSFNGKQIYSLVNDSMKSVKRSINIRGGRVSIH